MNFLIADVIQFVSVYDDNFLRRGSEKIKSKQFSEFGSRTIMDCTHCELLNSLVRSSPILTGTVSGDVKQRK